MRDESPSSALGLHDVTGVRSDPFASGGGGREGGRGEEILVGGGVFGLKGKRVWLWEEVGRLMCKGGGKRGGERRNGG